MHPLLTESVISIVGRADLLAALGVLAGLLCYWKGRAAQRSTLIWVLGLAGAQLLGIFSKENAVILIPLMVVCDLAWPVASRLAKRATFYGAAAFVCAAYFLARMQLHSHIEVQFIDNPWFVQGFGVPA